MQEHASYHERDLLLQVCQGDEQAFSSLFHRYKKKLFGFIFDFTGSEQKAEDILQEIFLKIWLNRSGLKEIKNFNAYLFRMARNHAMDHLRRISRETLILSAIIRQGDPERSGPEEVLLQKEIHEKLREAIDHLPPQQKKIYILHREHGLKQDEIARRLNLSLSTVQNHIYCGLNNIRKYLTRCYSAAAFYYIIMAAGLLKQARHFFWPD